MFETMREDEDYKMREMFRVSIMDHDNLLTIKMFCYKSGITG